MSKEREEEVSLTRNTTRRRLQLALDSRGLSVRVNDTCTRSVQLAQLSKISLDETPRLTRLADEAPPEEEATMQRACEKRPT